MTLDEQLAEERERLIKVIEEMESYDKITVGTYQTYDEMQVCVPDHGIAGDWLNRDDVLAKIREGA